MTYGEWVLKNRHVAIGYTIGWALVQLYTRLVEGMHNSWISSIVGLFICFFFVSYIWYKISEKKDKNGIVDESDKE